LATQNKYVKDVAGQEYKYGFVTDVEEEQAPRGLTEDTVRWISAKKSEPEFMLEWRLKAFKHFMSLLDQSQIPEWANIKHAPIDFQDIIYYSAPKKENHLGQSR
jgi:Fe-S cluster assembly protein SufB